MSYFARFRLPTKKDFQSSCSHRQYLGDLSLHEKWESVVIWFYVSSSTYLTVWLVDEVSAVFLEVVQLSHS